MISISDCDPNRYGALSVSKHHAPPSSGLSLSRDRRAVANTRSRGRGPRFCACTLPRSGDHRRDVARDTNRASSKTRKHIAKVVDRIDADEVTARQHGVARSAPACDPYPIGEWSPAGLPEQPEVAIGAGDGKRGEHFWTNGPSVYSVLRPPRLSPPLVRHRPEALQHLGCDAIVPRQVSSARKAK